MGVGGSYAPLPRSVVAAARRDGRSSPDAQGDDGDASDSTTHPLQDSSPRKSSSSGSSSGSQEDVQELSAEAFAEELKKAVTVNDVESVRALLARRADVNHTYQMGLTLLHFAALHNHPEAARVLVAFGANTEATTTDEAKLTAAGIAMMEGHRELFDVLAEDPQTNPLRSRLLGPTVIIAVLILGLTCGMFLMDPDTQWETWENYVDNSGGAIVEEGSWHLYESYTFKVWLFILCSVCVVCLFLVNVLDPGSVEREEVAFINELRALPEDQIIVRAPSTPVEDESFALVHSDSGRALLFRWCRSCKFWKPNHVSHCSSCRGCFWRFDHHCDAVGNCIAARNHRFFAIMLISGAAAWTLCTFAVATRIADHSSLSDAATWVPLRSSQGPLYLGAAFTFLSVLANLVFVPFSLFHLGCVVFNVSTRMLLKPGKGGGGGDASRWCLTRQEWRQICCLSMRLRGPFFGPDAVSEKPANRAIAASLMAQRFLSDRAARVVQP